MCVLIMTVKSNLGVVVGELSSGYLLVLVLRVLWICSAFSPQLSLWVSLFREMFSRSALALALSFSLSVWLTGPMLLMRLPAFVLPPSFPLVGMVAGKVGMGLRLRRLASMLLLTGREAARPVKLIALDLAGRGRLRY